MLEFSNPNPTPIFHILTIESFKKVLECGYLFCRNMLQAYKIECDDISYEDIQDRRHSIIIPYSFGATLHDYVPFYFAPRSPMLYTLHRQNVRSGFDQKNAIYLVTSAQKVAQAGLEYVFFDAHAIMAVAHCYNKLDDLNKINWRIFLENPPIRNFGYNCSDILPLPLYCKIWNDRCDNPDYANRKAQRQAEFNIKNKVDINFFDCIVVYDMDKKKQVEKLLNQYRVLIPVCVIRSWYY